MYVDMNPPTNCQNFTQKYLTEVKIFQKFMGATFLKHPVHSRYLFSRAAFASQIVRDYLEPFKCYKTLKVSRDPKIVHQTPLLTEWRTDRTRSLASRNTSRRPVAPAPRLCLRTKKHTDDNSWFNIKPYYRVPVEKLRNYITYSCMRIYDYA